MLKTLPLLFFLNLVFSIQAQNEITFDSIQTLTYKTSDCIQKQDYQGALEYATLAVRLAEETDDKKAKSAAYNALANSYQMLGETESTEKYLRTSLEYSKEINDYSAMVSSTNSLAYLYLDHYKDPDKALEYYKKSLGYATQLNQSIGIFVAAFNISDLLLDLNKTDQAEEYIQIAWNSYNHYSENIPKFGDYVPYYDLVLQQLIGDFYKQKNKYPEALAYFDKAAKIGEEHDFYADLVDIHIAKSDIYKENGQLALAVESMEKQLQYTQLNFDLEKSKQIETISAQFKVDEIKRDLEVAEKEKEMFAELSQSKSRTINISIISIIMLLLAIGLMYYGYKKRKANYELKLQNATLVKEKKDVERLTQLKSKFISRVSHEIRTPLHGIIGITSMLEEDTEVTEKHKELINALKFSGNHLTGLVDTLIDIRQLEYQNTKLHIRETDLRELADNIVNSFQFQARQKRNHINQSVDNRIANFYKVDSVRLSKIVIHLIENAIKYTQDGKIDILIELEEKGDKEDLLRFAVRDTGEGISENNLSLIFDTFNQAKEELNIDGGVGLGLAMVKYQLLLMNSRIEVESTLGEGSVFSFVLALPKAKKPLITQKEGEKFSFKKLLVVEDNKISQMVTGKLIKLIGHSCNIVDNGLKALEAIKNQEFDLILMDLNMPVMNGFDAAREIKSYGSRAKIIALTATDISKVRERCFSSGMIDVISKPISKQQLDVLIKKYAS